ncbi:MAG TPA: PAS domain S-box protein [Candidatus Angelobacter sp.]
MTTPATNANSLAPSNWDARGSNGHSVQFYEEDAFLLAGLSRFIGAAIAAGDSAIVIATESHREELRKRLVETGLDLGVAGKQGRFVSVDAAETLARFMVRDRPDPERFEKTIGGIIAKLSSAARQDGQVVAFGEMVALLWAEGNQQAALELEQLWNRLQEKHAFHLHCAYPMNLFSQATDATGIESICTQHSHITPAEQFTNLQTEKERLRSIAVLQQKAQALETEIREREKAQAALQSREAELTDFLENAVMAMHWVAADGAILWANRAELSLLGYTRDEYLGHHIAEFHADKNAIQDILQRLTSGEELHGYKSRLLCKDGSIRDVRIHSNVLARDGKVAYTRCFTIDVTEQERSQRRIAAQHAVSRLLAESDGLAAIAKPILETLCGGSDCDMGSLWLVQEGKLRCLQTWRSNKEFPELDHINASASFSKGEGLPGRIWAGNKPVWIEDVAVDSNFPRAPMAIKDGVRSAFGFPLSTNQGPLGVIEFFSCDQKKTDEEFMGMISSVGHQIGQFLVRKKAEHELQESEARLRVMTEATPILVWMAGTDKLCYYFNKTWLEFVGRSLEQESGNGWAENVHHDDFDRCLQIYVSSFDARRPFEMEYRLRHHSGQYRWILDHGVPRFAPDGTFEGYVGGCLDIHDQKEAREKLRLSQERLQAALISSQRLAAIVESSDDAIISKDLNGIITSWNKGAEQLFGYTAEEIVGRHITLVIPPELQQDEDTILSKIRRGEKIEHFETVRVKKNGERVDVSLTISPVRDEQGNVIGAAKIARDVTESRKIDRALRTTEKLAAAGRLAATVAHEINNPLESVTNLVYLAKRDLPDSSKVSGYLQMAGRELDRVAHIARQTLGFYRDTSSPVRFNLTQLLDELLLLYEKRFETRNIKLIRQYDRDVEITALAGEVRQALSNLVTNAIDAMPGGGQLFIRISRSRNLKNSVAGVRVMVADTGTGIASEHRSNLFQPFFTTKTDVGTGLGLWITRNIVEKHGGDIQVKTKVGAGTAFCIFLPAETKASSPISPSAPRTGIDPMGVPA